MRWPCRLVLLTFALLLGAGWVGGRRAQAADDAVEAYRRAVRSLAQQERDELEGLARQAREALNARRIIRMEFRAGRRATLDDCDEALRTLFEPFAAREERRAEALNNLAGSGSPRAGSTLREALFENAEAAAALDQTMLEAHPIAEAIVYDPILAFQRMALARRETHLLEALARVPEAGALLGPEAWRAATLADGRQSAARRVAFLDAAARLPAPTGLASLVGGLGSELVCLREAALEAAAQQGAAGEAVLVQALVDPHVLVRRAALAGLRRLAPAGGKALEPTLARLDTARGVERDEVFDTLRVLAGRDLGRDPVLWKAWVLAQTEAIAAGSFDARTPANDPAPTVPTSPAGPGFLGLELRSERLVFVIDWTISMVLPADVVFARTRKRIDWFGADDDWVGQGGQERLQTVVRRELARALGALPAAVRFGLVVLRDGNRDAWPRIAEESVLGSPRLLEPERASLARVDRALGDVPPGWSRWHEPMDGIWHAADLAHLGPGPLPALGEPTADTLVFVGSGELRGGRFLFPEEAVAALARWNRFRRFVIHTVRVADEGRDADLFLRGLAAATGGQHVHLTRAP